MQARMATVEDRERLVALREVAGWDADRVDGWLEECAAGRRLLWLAERDGADVAMVALLLAHEDPEVADGRSCVCMTSLVVLPSERGRGVGRRLTALAEHEARRRGVGVMTLYTRVENEAAIALYRSLGYVEWKRGTFDWGPAVYLRKLL